jgi:glycine betaine/proline transport system permease protein
MKYLIEFPELSKEVLRSLKRSIDDSFREFSRSYGDSIESLFDPLLFIMIWIERFLVYTPWPIILSLFIAVTYYFTKSKWLTIGLAIYLILVGMLGLWPDTMYTISLVIVSTTISIGLGIPIGILASKSNIFIKIITPILDVMQTIPIFVYLIPVVILLGLGKIPGVIAMCIYAIPPIIRFTNLGLREVDKSIKEAAQSCGANEFQCLYFIELPMAKKTILAGINQTIMMSISMVIIASMIGVQGLGTQVLQAVQNQYIGTGLIVGAVIVGLAVFLDRIIQSIK